jgi:type IV secretion system protein VirB10
VQALRLRADHPRITRLSRKVLAGGTSLALLLISGAVLWALRSNHPHNPAPDELYSTDHHSVADGLTTLPQDYAGLPRDVPRLGPPLPGDLGRPIGTVEGQSVPIGLDAEQQRANQETEAARTSKVFASTAAPVTPPHAASPEMTTNTASSSDETFTQNGQDRKLLFVNAPVDRRTTAPDRVSRTASPFVVQAGTIIPAALITGIRSDLPGQITAQVTENVFDSPTGRFLLIQQGARLIGIYDSQIAFGQSRVLLVWTRLIMPNGRSIVLERQPGADTAGFSGLEDEVDNHWVALFKAALLSTLLGVGSELGTTSGTGSNSDVITALRRGSSDSLNQTGQKIVQRNLNIQPTLTIRPGFPVRVIVNRDLVLEPYKG